MMFESTTSGCSSDFEHAMHIAKLMVYQVGMGDSGYVGDFSILEGGEGRGPDALSNELKKMLNDDVLKILERCLKQATDLLTKEKTLLEKMSEKLLEKKTLEYDEVNEICKRYGVGKERRIEERGLLQEFQKLVMDSAASAQGKITADKPSIPPPKQA